MRRVIPVLLVLFAAVGCQAKLDDASTITVEGGDRKTRILEAIPFEQKIKVEAQATTGQFNVFVYLQKDKLEVERDMNVGKKSPKFIAFKTATKQEELTAVIPANNVAIVTVTSSNGAKAVVNLRLSN